MWQRVGCSVCRLIPNVPWPARKKLELGLSEFVLLKMENDSSLIASSRRDGVAYVRETVQKARARREWVGSAPKETSDGRTPVGPDKSFIGT